MAVQTDSLINSSQQYVQLQGLWPLLVFACMLRQCWAAWHARFATQNFAMKLSGTAVGMSKEKPHG